MFKYLDFRKVFFVFILLIWYLPRMESKQLFRILFCVLTLAYVDAAERRAKKKRTTMDEFWYVLGVLQVLVFGPMILVFVINVVRDPAFKEILRGAWKLVQSKTLTHLSSTAIKHSTLANKQKPN